MFDETGEETLIQQQSVKKQSLLKKYDISLDKLSFEYVAECKNVKELERIVKILRSGEEGFYEELQRQAENRLTSLAPNSRILRKEEPILMKDSLIQTERDEVDNDMKQWESEISSKDLELADWNKNCTSETGSGDYIPPVRRAPEKKGDENKKQTVDTKTIKKPMMSDYATWDKYDVDSELLKMDAEEERKQQEDEVKERREKMSAEAEERLKEHDRLQDIIKTSHTMPDAEKCCLALREKDRGNEYYKACNYEDAIDYYTASVAICPNAVSFNNRAASYLKQGKYDLALNDVNKCLELEPENTKGLYRRGLCLQHKNRFDEALEDMQTVLRKEPHNLLVQHVAKELRQQCRSVPRSVRMLVEEQQEDKVVEVTEAEAKGMKDGYEVNEWGLARSMCGCYGRPQFMRNLDTTSIAEHLIYKPEDDKRKKKKMDGFDDNKAESVVDRSSLSKICTPTIEPMCNGNIDTNRLIKSDSDDETEVESVPKKIKIIETVKLNNSSTASSVKETSDKPKKGVVVKDMRGQTPRIKVQGQNESDMMEQFGNITIDESVPPFEDPTNDNMHEVKAKKLNSNQKQQSQNNANNNNDNNNECNKQESESNASHRRPARNYVFHVPSEKHHIPVATKYTTQKVTSNRNANINITASKDDALFFPSSSSPEYSFESQSNNNNNNYSSNNINENGNIPIVPNTGVSEKETMTPFQFFQLWSSIKDTKACLKEYADVLRRISPARLRAILGNKLDGTMLVTMIKSLANEFDITDNEGDLVKQYLVSISNLDRFQIIVGFLTNDIQRLICGLIEKVGGDEKTELKKAYMITQE